MRIWDVPPAILCRQHLLGKHRELHGLWRILSEGRSGYANHPETQRWRGKLVALYQRHDALVDEMLRRGYRHASPLDPRLAKGEAVQREYVDTPESQLAILRQKGCPCMTGSGQRRRVPDPLVTIAVDQRFSVVHARLAGADGSCLSAGNRWHAIC